MRRVPRSRSASCSPTSAGPRASASGSARPTSVTFLGHFYEIGSEAILGHDGSSTSSSATRSSGCSSAGSPGPTTRPPRSPPDAELLERVGRSDATPSGPIPLGGGVHTRDRLRRADGTRRGRRRLHGARRRREHDCSPRIRGFRGRITGQRRRRHRSRCDDDRLRTPKARRPRPGGLDRGSRSSPGGLTREQKAERQSPVGCNVGCPGAGLGGTWRAVARVQRPTIGLRRSRRTTSRQRPRASRPRPCWTPTRRNPTAS